MGLSFSDYRVQSCGKFFKSHHASMPACNRVQNWQLTHRPLYEFSSCEAYRMQHTRNFGRKCYSRLHLQGLCMHLASQTGSQIIHRMHAAFKLAYIAAAGQHWTVTAMRREYRTYSSPCTAPSIYTYTFVVGAITALYNRSCSVTRMDYIKIADIEKWLQLSIQI